jgi:2-polyprenyl-6-methoxyphenol hydroxylase-like FAD-dependent oxidoreductase
MDRALVSTVRHVIVAGGGIAGLTAALALARAGLRATVYEQTERLEEAGAGIQLSPNASRVLIEFGLRESLAASATVPQAIRVLAGGSGREIVRIPLGDAMETLYGAPYWVIHRGDLQAALLAAVRGTQDITLRLGQRIEDFASHANGITVLVRGHSKVADERGMALIGADGLWSTVATRLRRQRSLRFAHRTAWRALVSADIVPEEFRANLVQLWLGHDAHLVHYPVKAGKLINIVAIVPDEWSERGWSAAGDRSEILRHFRRWSWAEKARLLVAVPERWSKWALYDRKTPFRPGTGAVTLIGDAAHPSLPFLAQGAATAIEDAAVLAVMLAEHRQNPSDGLRRYENARRRRILRICDASRQQGRIYELSGPEALLRNLGMRIKGGDRLRARYDWLYDWRPPELIPVEAPPL